MRLDPQSEEFPKGILCQTLDNCIFFYLLKNYLGRKGKDKYEREKKKILSPNDQTECVKLSARL